MKKEAKLTALIIVLAWLVVLSALGADIAISLVLGVVMGYVVKDKLDLEGIFDQFSLEDNDDDQDGPDEGGLTSSDNSDQF